MKLTKYFWTLGIIIFILTAIFSVGYHQADEHYQILEFANFKNGLTTKNYLPWEYKARIRPTLQPTIALGVIKLSQLFSIYSPFTQTTILRILIGLFSLLSIYIFTKITAEKIKEKNKIYFILLSLFSYFIPYLAVRFSAETLSADFFLIGLALIIKKYDSNKIGNSWYSHNFFIGILFGLSFITRYQSAILVAGLFLWLILFHKIKLKDILQLFGGISLVILLGIILDYWFYQEWVLSAWNYFKVNIIENKTAQFGKQSWYYYFKRLLDIGPIKLVNVIILSLLGLFIIKKYKNPIAFVIIPYIIVHLFIAHKELRFMFPIAFLLPFIMICSIEYIQEKIKSIRWKKIIIIVLVPFMLLNCLGLIVKTFAPADGGILVYKYIYDNYKNKDVKIYYLNEVYGWHGRQAYLMMNFYDTKRFMLQKNSKINKNEIKNINNRITTLIILKNTENISDLPLKPVYQILPNWLTKKYDPKNRMRIKNADWIIYEVIQ